MNSATLIFAFMFIFGAAAIAAAVAWNVGEKKRRHVLDKRLERILSQKEVADADLLKRDTTSDVLVYGKLLDQFRFTGAMREHLAQANLKWSVGRLTAMMLACAFLALNIAFQIPLIPIYLVPLIALFAGFLPYGYVLRRRQRRLAAFEEQFPDALDFLGRALRAGHAFSIGLEMLASESSDPLASEFRQTFDEQNLGLPLDTALINLSRRVPLLDVRFFVSAVMIQTRTGGNLSEILDKLAYVVRERFKLKGQVRALSAHGRLTGKILTVLPLVVVLLMMLVDPAYMMVLVKNPYGKHLIGAAIIMQCIAYAVMRKIVDIKV